MRIKNWEGVCHEKRLPDVRSLRLCLTRSCFQGRARRLAQTLPQVSRFLVILLCACSLGFAIDSKLERVKDKYQIIQVEAFEIQKGVDFPPELLSSLQDEVTKQLRQSKEFPEVLAAGGASTNADAPVLRLTGTLTHFKPGSRAKRYFAGFGAGSTEIFAQLTFIDRATGQTVLSENVRVVLAGGFAGGASSDVTKQFARQVVDTTKLIGERRLPQPAQPVSGAIGVNCKLGTTFRA